MMPLGVAHLICDLLSNNNSIIISIYSQKIITINYKAETKQCLSLDLSLNSFQHYSFLFFGRR